MGAAGERRIVSALCYDMVGSTDLFQRLDIEDYSELIAAVQAAAKQAITSCSGVVKVIAGDGGLALFPIELGAKDGASLAVRAGLAIIDACKRAGAKYGHGDVRLRVGVATSVALIHARQADGSQEPVTGAALALATRLEALAEPDTVLVSEETRNLAGRSHAFVFQGTRALKGFATPLRVWRASPHRKEVDRFYAFGNLIGPFIGRDDELEAIASCWRKVCDGTGEILLLEGEAGLGKSRLLREVRKMTRDARVKSFFFQCSVDGAHSTLHPLMHGLPGQSGQRGTTVRLTSSAVSSQFARNGIDDVEAVDVFAHMLGADGGHRPLSDLKPGAIRERAHRAVFRALQAMCKNGPIVLAVEDIHWIDPTSQDLLTAAMGAVQHLPVLLVITSRPVRERAWLEDHSLTRLTLRPLTDDETRQAIEAMWPKHRSAMLAEFLDVAEHISGGVPLFIEEICQWASEGLKTDSMKLASTVSPDRLSAFESIVDARLSQVGSAREVVRAGAVAGSRFTLDLLKEMLPGFSRKALLGAANTLCDMGLLSRLRMPGPTAYGFRHMLIQETIYNTLLQKQRRELHRRLFNACRQIDKLASWMDTGALAQHAEYAGLLEDAVGLFIAAGTDHSSRSALIEARHHLEHALALCEQFAEANKAELLQLAAFAALGPILTGTVGMGSPAARDLYERGIEIARRQPVETQPRWFPIYWGWWQTGADFRTMHDRALQVQSILSAVNDPEIQLQVNHSIWAIDFNLGRHRETQAAIEAGLAFYDESAARTGRTLFGGHDAKVCALGQLALSLWLTGDVAGSDAALSDMISFVDRISHTPSKAHSLDTEAVSAFYRDDYEGLSEVAASMAGLSRQHDMPSLFGLSQLFGGWADVHRGKLADGYETFQEGLSLLRGLGAVIDLPIYLYMHASMLGLARDYATAIEVVGDAIENTNETGHRYWLSELYRCRAGLNSHNGASGDVIAEDLVAAFHVARSQGAATLQRRAEQTARELGIVLEP
nr:AAA family ATPase [Pararhizobium capsulatum]